MGKRKTPTGPEKHSPKDCAKHSFPSPRQARAPGLQKGFYPPFLRELLDADYLDELAETERVWLAAFLEEHLRGWRLKNETQINSVEAIRESARDAKRQRDHQDPGLFAVHRGPSFEELVAQSEDDCSSHAEATLVAGMSNQSVHELESRNWTEDRMLESLDRHRKAQASTNPVAERMLVLLRKARGE